MSKTYDPIVEDLARYFLGDKARPKQVMELAQVIQDAIEAHMAGTTPE